MRLFAFTLFLSIVLIPAALSDELTQDLVEVFEADGDFYQGRPREWLVNRSPSVLDPSQVPEPEDTTVYAEDMRE